MKTIKALMMGNKFSKMPKTTMSPILAVNIDFDEASNEWNRNKKSIGNGQKKYVCGCDTNKGNPCQNKPIALSPNGFCSLHNGKLSSEK